MTIDNINIDAILKNAAKFIAEGRGLSPATKSLFEILVLIITLLTNRLNLNSNNSSKPRQLTQTGIRLARRETKLVVKMGIRVRHLKRSKTQTR